MRALRRLPSALRGAPAARRGLGGGAPAPGGGRAVPKAGLDAHNRSVREEFNRQSAEFDSLWHQRNASKGWLEPWILKHLPLAEATHALDVACGTGLCARSLAPCVASVTGVDTTPGMLNQAKELSAKEGLTNMDWQLGEAEALPFEDGSFDLVTCRLAVHHFLLPELQLAEMVRVARPGGHVAIIDIVSPEDLELAKVYNRLEVLRDPTHTRALPISELRSMLAACAPSVSFVAADAVSTPSVSSPVHLEGWMQLTRTPEDHRREILEAVTAELEGGPATGMRPWRDEKGNLRFYHEWAVVVAKV